MPVAAVPDGASTVTLPAPGTPGYSSVERIAFRRFGRGPELLLVMGEDGTMSWWEPSFLSSLAQHYAVTVFDLPGVGYSQAPTAKVSLAWYADETAGLARSLGLSRPTVLGWGLGADVTLELAERHPAIPGSVVLVDSAVGGSLSAEPAPSIQSLLGWPSGTAAALAPSMFTPGLAAARTVWLSGVTAGVPDDITAAGMAEENAVTASLWTDPTLAADTSLLQVSTLVAYGTGDLFYPSPDATDLVAAIAGAQSLPIAGAGYAAMFEGASQFIAALEQFTG